MNLSNTRTGYSAAQKPATSLKEIHEIEIGLEHMWAKNKKLYKFAKEKTPKKASGRTYLLDEKELL